MRYTYMSNVNGTREDYSLMIFTQLYTHRGGGGAGGCFGRMILTNNVLFTVKSKNNPAPLAEPRESTTSAFRVS